MVFCAEIVNIEGDIMFKKSLLYVWAFVLGGGVYACDVLIPKSEDIRGFSEQTIVRSLESHRGTFEKMLTDFQHEASEVVLKECYRMCGLKDSIEGLQSYKISVRLPSGINTSEDLLRIIGKNPDIELIRFVECGVDKEVFDELTSLGILGEVKRASFNVADLNVKASVACSLIKHLGTSDVFVRQEYLDYSDNVIEKMFMLKDALLHEYYSTDVGNIEYSCIVNGVKLCTVNWEKNIQKTALSLFVRDLKQIESDIRAFAEIIGKKRNIDLQRRVMSISEILNELKRIDMP